MSNILPETLNKMRHFCFIYLFLQRTVSAMIVHNHSDTIHNVDEVNMGKGH